MLKIALPKGKSLEERTVALFSEARIQVVRLSPASHTVHFDGYEALSYGVLLKPSRVPILVADGNFDIGITGEDAVLESGADVEICAELAYSRTTDTHTQGVLFAHKDNPVKSVDMIPSGAVILSEYPNLTRQFFSGKQAVEIVCSPGSAEAEVPLKYPFGVALSETGRSLRDNDLVILKTLFASNTVLIANKQSLADKDKREEINMLKLLLLEALHARNKVMLSMNVAGGVLERVLRILPALGTPTIASLAERKSFSVSSVVPEKDVNRLILELLKLGAKGIIVMPITSVIEG